MRKRLTEHRLATSVTNAVGGELKLEVPMEQRFNVEPKGECTVLICATRKARRDDASAD